ncbi:restriction endonuclease subunit S [bacterium SCSIO 12741]|nr:restriction endonuclease subunit S [bacterium SCSIO 12741]
MELLKHFKALTLHPKNAQELRGLILQLAIEGKLTSEWRRQNPDIESASDLLKKIQEEKVRLVKLGKIRRTEEIQLAYNIYPKSKKPKKWKVVPLGNIVEIVRGVTFPSSEKSIIDSSENIPCLRTANVQEKVDWDDLIYVNRKFVKRDDQILRLGDVIMSMANSKELVGKVALIDNQMNREYTLGGFISAIRPYKVDSNYLAFFLKAPSTRTNLILSSSQTTNIANISVGRLRPIEIPIPPIEEQKVIVHIVNQLFDEVNQLENLTQKRVQLKENWVTSALRRLSQSQDTELQRDWEMVQQHLGTFFTEKTNVQKLRETILQLAVQGKLTAHWRSIRQAQEPPMEPASELLTRIQKEKARLVKEGKIRKERTLPPILPEEVPFELPKGWVWCRFGELVKFMAYGTSQKTNDNDENVPVLRMGNITSKGQLTFGNLKYIPPDHKDLPKLYLDKYDLVFNRTNSYDLVGKSGVYFGEGFTYTLASYLIKVSLVMKFVDPVYINNYINSMICRVTQINPQITAQTNQANFSGTKLRNILVPFAPLIEQKVIVEKVNGLMALCDRLEEQIELKNRVQEDWMKSCLKQVFS